MYGFTWEIRGYNRVFDTHAKLTSSEKHQTLDVKVRIGNIGKTSTR